MSYPFLRASHCVRPAKLPLPVLRLIRTGWPGRDYDLQRSMGGVRILFPYNRPHPITLSVAQFELAMEVSCDESEGRFGFLRLIEAIDHYPTRHKP